MIAVSGLSKSFGPKVLLESVGFKINPGEKIGLVGKNGHGKSTLMKIISGEAKSDSGEIILPKGYKVGYLSQLLEFEKKTILEEVENSLSENQKGETWRAEKILSGLGFKKEDFSRHPKEFSSGYQVRINLAKLLVEEPDFLMLDEPTNYLDITSIRWLKDFLKKWNREFLLITHDRSFMDSVITHVLGIHRQKVKKVEGDTSKFYEQIALEEEIYEKTRQNQEKKRKEIELFVTRFRAKARLAGMVQSRVKTLAKMDKRDKLQQLENLEFSFNEISFPGKHVMGVQDLCFGYEPGKNLINNLSFNLNHGDKVGIIGQNGRGKTTLVKVLAGILDKNSGEVSINNNVESAVYIQDFVEDLNLNNTVADEIYYANPEMDKTAVRSICGAMLFSGDDALKPVSILSGGERSRVMLGKLLATPTNLLFLDEPTNHLDMDSCDALVTALDYFSGSVLMVTHNEMLLDAVAEKLIVFKDDEVFFFDGRYSEFLEKIGWDEEKNNSNQPQEKIPAIDKKTLKRLRAEIIQKKSKEVSPLKKRIDKIEETIMNLEEEDAELGEKIQEASEAGDSKSMTEISMKIGEIQKKIETLFEELEEKSETLQSIEEKYEKELNKVGI